MLRAGSSRPDAPASASFSSSAVSPAHSRFPVIQSSSEMKVAGKAAVLAGWTVEPFDLKMLQGVLDQVPA